MAHNLVLKGQMVKEEGLTSLKRIVEIADQHLCYQPLSYSTWDSLARESNLTYIFDRRFLNPHHYDINIIS